MSYIAPTDVTEPPPGWSWAKKEVYSWRQSKGEVRFKVSQETPNGYRSSVPMEEPAANDLMRKWNDEAKQ